MVVRENVVVVIVKEASKSDGGDGDGGKRVEVVTVKERESHDGDKGEEKCWNGGR